MPFPVMPEPPGDAHAVMTTQDAYGMGYCAESILDNPFWADYPKDPGSHEADLGRAFVDGWLTKEMDAYD